MKRREFLRYGAAFTAASDLSVVALQRAIESAGLVDPPRIYRLHVHPEQAQRAEQVLRELFKDEWRAHLVLEDLFTNVDTWYLEGSKAIVHSAGA